MNALRFLYSNLDHFRRRFLFVFLAGCIDGIALFCLPLLLAQFTRSNFTYTRLVELSTWMLVCYACSLVCQWVLRRYGEALAPQYALHLRLKYFDSLEGLSTTKLAQYHSGYLLSLIHTVAEGMGGLTNEIFWGVAKSLATLVLFFYFTYAESLTVALINLLLLTTFVAISTYLARRMIPLATELNVARAALIERYSDFLANILTVKKLAIYPFANRQLKVRIDKTSQGITQLQNFHAARWFILHSLFGAAFLSTIIFLLYRVTAGTGSLSTLILFIAAYGIVRGNIERLSEDFKTVIEISSYLDTLNEIVVPVEPRSVIRPNEGFSEIRFSGLSFSHPGNAALLRVPEFYLRRGEKVSISGDSGQGKTTFLNLFANYLEPDSGNRYLDGDEYAQVPVEFFRSQLVLLSQEVELFSLSLRDNINLGRELPDGEIKFMFRALGLEEWLHGLADGLDTLVGEKGLRLSSGQKQRVNLIRGVSLDREIYLLDEPTAHLDTVTEGRVVEFLSHFLKDRTAILVSHRPAPRSLCSRHYEVKEGVLRPSDS